MILEYIFTLTSLECVTIREINVAYKSNGYLVSYSFMVSMQLC